MYYKVIYTALRMSKKKLEIRQTHCATADKYEIQTHTSTYSSICIRLMFPAAPQCQLLSVVSIDRSYGKMQNVTRQNTMREQPKKCAKRGG